MLAVHYDWRLVALSILIAIGAAHAGLHLATRVWATSGISRTRWIAGGAFAMGMGIWSMHYIGMLAFQLPVPVHYDVWLVVVSLVAAIVASAIALVFVARDECNIKQLVLGGTAMGAAIGGMHYVGMAAMRMNCACRYDWRVVGLSVVVAASGSSVALARFRQQSKSKRSEFLAAILLGLAIGAMHYTGMAAARFSPVLSHRVDFSNTVSVSTLSALGIAVVAAFVLLLAAAGSHAQKRFSAQSTKLQATEERYRVLFERSMAGIYRATVDGVILDMNESCRALLGYGSSAAAVGEQIADRFEAGEFGAMQAAPAPREVRLNTLSGRHVWAMHSATILEGGEHDVAEIQGMLLSIDELKRTEEALRSAKCTAESANLTKSRFLANMSHELRTPLNGILGLTDLAMDMSQSREQSELLELVKTCANSLVSVIEDVLEFSNLEATRIMLASEAFNLRHVAESIVNSALATAQKKRLRLEVEVSPDVAPRFLGDVRYVREIIEGLFDNALKFTEAGKVGIRIEAASSSENAQIVRIAVYDTGIGIPADKHSVIFEPFSQADDSDARRFGGTGLGLAIVRNLAEAMGGQISLASRVGEGSTFTVLIPLHVTPPIGTRIAA